MNALEAIKFVAYETGTNLSQLSKTLGKHRAYLNATITRGSMPKIDTFIKVLYACGYGVIVKPINEIKDDEIQITIDE